MKLKSSQQGNFVAQLVLSFLCSPIRLVDTGSLGKKNYSLYIQLVMARLYEFCTTLFLPRIPYHDLSVPTSEKVYSIKPFRSAASLFISDAKS